MSRKMLALASAATLFAAGVFFSLTAPPDATGRQSAAFPKPAFDADGKLIRPDISYRQWVYVGTPLTPNELNPPEAPFPEFHNVYIHPDDFDHYSRTGEFPDGTVMVKELVLVGSKQAVSGTGYFMGEFTGLEATIKDSTRFPDEPGFWAYFTFGHEYPLADKSEAFPTGACNACHAASAADDFVFTQYYPVLRAAKASRGGGEPMTSDSEQFQDIMVAMLARTDASRQASIATGPAPGEVPTSDAALHDYLRSAAYQQMPHRETGNHASAGPHAKFGRPVRVFMNDILGASLDAGNARHPVGSEVVKEMYLPDGALEGWAVMVKTDDDTGTGQDWFWYEVTSTEAGADAFMSGNGIPLCFGCHASGTDFVLTGWPLR